jgi:hypothetical protein
MMSLLSRLLRRAPADPDYSPAYQDEYQRKWHQAAARVKELEELHSRDIQEIARINRILWEIDDLLGRGPRRRFKAIATFTPQAWVRDNAIEVDPEGPTEWITQFEDLSTEQAEKILECGHDLDDLLKEDPAAPEWVREYRGPFEIHVRKIKHGVRDVDGEPMYSADWLNDEGRP